MPNMDQSDEDVRREVLLLFDRVEDWIEPYFDVGEDSYKLYRMYRDSTQWPYVNSVFTPDTFGFVEDATAKIYQAFFASSPIFAVEPGYGIDPKLAKQVERGLQFYIMDDDAEFPLEFEEFIKSGAIYGNGYMGCVPRIAWTRNGPVFHGLQFTNKDFWSIYPDMRARRINKRARGVFDRDVIYYEEFEEYTEAGIFTKVSKDDMSKAGDDSDSHKELLAEIGVETFQPDDDDMVELLNFHYGGDCVTLANRYHVVRNTTRGIPRTSPKPFVYGIPVVDYKYVAIPREFFGMGIPSIVKSLQEDKNLLRSQRRENIDLILNKIIRYKSGVGLNTDMFVFFPGALWPMHDPINDVAPMDLNDVTSSAYMEEEKIDLGMEMASGQYRYSMGQSPQRRETGVGIVRLQQAAMARFDTLIKRTEFHALRALALRSLVYIRAYEKPERWEKIIGEADRGFMQMPIQDIVDSFNLIPMGASVTAIKEQRAEQKMTGSQTLMGIPPEAAQQMGFSVNYYEAMMLALDALDLHGRDKYVQPLQQMPGMGMPSMGGPEQEVPPELLLQAINDQPQLGGNPNESLAMPGGLPGM